MLDLTSKTKRLKNPDQEKEFSKHYDAMDKAFTYAIKEKSNWHDVINVRYDHPISRSESNGC